MLETITGILGAETGLPLAEILADVKSYTLIIIGFSVVIFFHELGHFLAAKLCDVRVDKFAVGFGRELFGRTRGETRYSFNLLPLGGYVKMLGQEDFDIDKSGELKVKDDPRSFTHKPIGQRMFIVSSGVIMNLVFAALIFMLVFMIGVEFPSATIGLVEPESPAERAGLRIGDKIIKVDNKKIADYGDLKPAVMLSDPDKPMRLTIERPNPAGGDPSVQVVELQAEMDVDQDFLKIGIAPLLNNKVVYVLDDPALGPNEQLKVDDEILQVNGQEVSNFRDIFNLLMREKGRFVDLKVRRRGLQEDSEGTELMVKRRAQLTFGTTGKPYREGGHLLGLVPLRKITLINPGSRAALAGLKPGDVIVKWGQQIAPTLEEILNSIADNPERDIRVSVLRQSQDNRGQVHSFQVRPKSSGLFFKSKPKVGMDPWGQDNERLIVADIATNITEDIQTPTAKLKDLMPRGSLITKVNDQAVRTWQELSERFIALAGTDVKLSWSYQGRPEQAETIYVPHTLGTVFELPPWHKITKINDKTYIEVTRDGKMARYSASNWRGALELLRENIGKRIEIEHRGIFEKTTCVETITVTPEMLDTWVMRIMYHPWSDLITNIELTPIRETNPPAAMMIGVRKTYFFIEQVYMMIRRMLFTRSVGLEQISGPVGIVKMGSDVAKQSFVMLMYFLALISANLAVINFLPLPIVDGGLFIFLIIEKIKGSPISLRVQVATQVIGLMLIIGIFLFVTIQDIQKFAG